MHVPGLCKEEASQKILEGGAVQKLRQLLVDKDANQSLVAEVIAEIAKIGKTKIFNLQVYRSNKKLGTISLEHLGGEMAPELVYFIQEKELMNFSVRQA